MEITPVAPAFELENLVYRYQGITALDSLSLTILQGQRVVLLGANGCGKTTLLRILNALYYPEAGILKAFGEPLTEQRMQENTVSCEFRRRVGLVFQNPDVQLFNTTVFDELAFGPLQLHWSKEVILQQVTETMERMNLLHLKDRPPHRLSGGEKKRVALGSVLILDPDVLLLDEPTASLDPKSRSQLIELVSEWGSDSVNKTMVMATHDLDIVENVADYCVVLLQGQVIAQGTPHDILHNHELLHKASLLHSHLHSHAPHAGHPGYSLFRRKK
jgi:cobalt/nickel transport system ATP-binding protein